MNWLSILDHNLLFDLSPWSSLSYYDLHFSLGIIKSIITRTLWWVRDRPCGMRAQITSSTFADSTHHLTIGDNIKITNGHLNFCWFFGWFILMHVYDGKKKCYRSIYMPMLARSVLPRAGIIIIISQTGNDGFVWMMLLHDDWWFWCGFQIDGHELSLFYFLRSQ